PLEQGLVVFLLVVAPGAGFLEGLHRTRVHRHGPVLGLRHYGEPAGARRVVLVAVITLDQRLGQHVDVGFRLARINGVDRIRIRAHLGRLVLGEFAGTAGGVVHREVRTDLADAVPAGLVVVRQWWPEDAAR